MEPKANSTEEAEAATETLLKESTPVEDKGPSVPGGTLNTGEGAAAAPEGSTTLPPGPSSRGLKNPNRTSRQETWRAQETVVYSKEPDSNTLSSGRQEVQDMVKQSTSLKRAVGDVARCIGATLSRSEERARAGRMPFVCNSASAVEAFKKGNLRSLEACKEEEKWS